MEPISGNSPVRANQTQINELSQTQDQQEEQAQPQPRADSVSVSSPVQELQLQRSQVVEDLGRVQQSRANLEEQESTPSNSAELENLNRLEQQLTAEFPRNSETSNDQEVNSNQAQQLSNQLQENFQQQPQQALSAQAENVSEQTTLTLFQ